MTDNYNKNKNRYGEENDGFMFEPEVLTIQVEMLRKYANLNLRREIVDGYKDLEINCI